MGYDLKTDYRIQLEELRDKEYDIDFVDVAPNKVLVELFYFEPRDDDQSEGTIIIPKQTIIGATESVASMETKKGSLANQKFAGARGIVRVIKIGAYRSDVPEYDKIGDAFLKENVKLFRVPASEVEDSVLNLEFVTFMKNTMEHNTNTGKSAYRTPLPERVPTWQQEWKKYTFTNPLEVDGFTQSLLFEIPIRKLQAPIRI